MFDLVKKIEDKISDYVEDLLEKQEPTIDEVNVIVFWMRYLQDQEKLKQTMKGDNV